MFALCCRKSWEGQNQAGISLHDTYHHLKPKVDGEDREKLTKCAGDTFISGCCSLIMLRFGDFGTQPIHLFSTVGNHDNAWHYIAFTCRRCLATKKHWGRSCLTWKLFSSIVFISFSSGVPWIKGRRNLTIGSYVSVRSSRYEARGKFGEHERCVRVARGVAESNSSFLKHLRKMRKSCNSSFLSALQTSQVLNISMNAQLTYEPIVL